MGGVRGGRGGAGAGGGGSTQGVNVLSRLRGVVLHFSFGRTASNFTCIEWRILEFLYFLFHILLHNLVFEYILKGE